MPCIAILADIHGNLPALQAIIADLGTVNPDHVVVAGDLINGAPFNIEVLETVYQLRWTALRGNHEFYVLDHNTTRESEEKRTSKNIDWLTESVKNAGWFNYLAAMPDAIRLVYGNCPSVHVTHGIPFKNNQAITLHTSDEKIAKVLQSVGEPLYIAGHYHVPFERRTGRWHIVSPGGVGTPHHGLRQACYCVIRSTGNHWEVELRAVDYDFSLVEARFKAWRLVEKLGDFAILSYLQVRYARPIINAFLEWNDATHPNTDANLASIKEFLSQPAVMWHYFGEEFHFNRETLDEISPDDAEAIL